MNTLSKPCSKCGIIKPATSEFYYFDKQRNVLIGRCRECNRKTSQSWKERHQKEIKQYRDNYYKENKETILAKDKSKRIKLRDWYLDYNRKYYIDHRQERLDKHFLYRQDKKEALNIRSRNYAKEHPDKIRIIVSRRRARKMNLPNDFTELDWEKCLSFFNHCCAYCGNQQGFSNPIHADHILPLSKPNCPGTVPSNIVPACRSCNSSKHNNDLREWLLRIFGKRKTHKILKRIEDYMVYIANHV